MFARIGGKIRQGNGDIRVRCEKATRLLEKLVAGTPWIMLKGWHTLRHSAISIYLDQGYSFDQIAKWTGHVDPETQKLYTHRFDTNARERMDAISFEFGSGRQLRLPEGSDRGDVSLSPKQVRALLAQNQALKTQIRKMQAETPRVDSLRQRVRLLEKRLRERDRG